MSEYPAWTRPTVRTTCARSGRGQHPVRPVLTNTDLCGPCHGQFPRILQNIINAWPDVQDSVMRRPAREYTGMPGGSGGTKDASTYWNPAATMVLADVTDWYGFLARTIASERPAPHARPFIGPITADQHRRAETGRAVFTWSLDGTEEPRLGLAAIIRWHHRWLTHHPALGAALLDDAHRFQWAIGKALDPAAEQVTRITLDGHLCQIAVEQTTYGDRLCEGQLVGIIRPADHDKPSAIMCTINPGHAIPADQWQRLEQANAAKDYVTIGDAANYLGLSIRSAWRYATADNWRTTNTNPQGFHVADIYRTAQNRSTT